MHDVVVIGGGTAGTFAAIRLARAGADVAVVAAGPPSATMSRGLAFAGRGFPDDEDFRMVWSEVLPALVHGPDRYIGFDGTVVEAGRGWGCAAGVRSIGDSDVLVMDVPGLPGPTAAVLAWMAGEALGRPVRSARLRLPYAVEDFDLTPVLWARRFDDPAGRRELVDHLACRLADEHAGCILVPPILGIACHADVIGKVARDAGTTVLELAGGLGWPPGLRIAWDLGRALRAPGIASVRGVAMEALLDGDRVRAVVLESGETVEGRAFVLATGGLAGGGIRLEHALVESVLGLDVFLDGEPAKRPVAEIGLDPSALFGSGIADDHPVLGAGVRVDAKWRPVGMDRTPLYRNLVACGSVVARSGPLAKGLFIDPGTSALAGWLAGASAVLAGTPT